MSNDLQKLLKKFMEEYESELNEARKDKDFKRPLGNIVRKDIACLIGAQLPENIYKVKGSVGAGSWADVPWVGVFDKRVTTSAQRGVYIVYLLKTLSKRRVWCLNILKNVLWIE